MPSFPMREHAKPDGLARDAETVRRALPDIVYGTVGHEAHAALERLVRSAKAHPAKATLDDPVTSP